MCALRACALCVITKLVRSSGYQALECNSEHEVSIRRRTDNINKQRQKPKQIYSNALHAYVSACVFSVCVCEYKTQTHKT